MNKATPVLVLRQLVLVNVHCIPVASPSLAAPVHAQPSILVQESLPIQSIDRPSNHHDTGTARLLGNKSYQHPSSVDWKHCGRYNISLSNKQRVSASLPSSPHVSHAVAHGAYLLTSAAMPIPKLYIVPRIWVSVNAQESKEIQLLLLLGGPWGLRDQGAPRPSIRRKHAPKSGGVNTLVSFSLTGSRRRSSEIRLIDVSRKISWKSLATFHHLPTVVIPGSFQTAFVDTSN